MQAARVLQPARAAVGSYPAAGDRTLLLRYVKSRWKGSQHSGTCPCAACRDKLEDPAHYVLECVGLADLRARHPRCWPRPVGAQAAMQVLFSLRTLLSCGSGNGPAGASSFPMLKVQG